MAKGKKFKIRKSQNIGSPDAETDENLFKVFVEVDNLEEIINTRNQKSILIGRTGSGKSAIIKYLKKDCETLVEISPEAMSLRFLSNSTILNYFKDLGVNLNLFYKVLWKHVFIVELLKMYFPENERATKKKSAFFYDLIERFKSNSKKQDRQKERAVKYMQEWTNDFWEKTEYRVQSFEKNIQSQFVASMGYSIEALNARLEGGSSESQTIKIEAKNKAESIIHNSQANELLDIIEIMKTECFTSHQKKFYIVVDDLDKEWVQDDIRYELIAAMVEVIKEFRQLEGVQIVISLRENLNEIVFSSQKNKGGQREKFKPLFSKLEWEKENLIEFLNQRLSLLSEKQLNVKSAFFDSRRGKGDGVNYMLERTFYRPRDVISFVNHAIENANNKEYFTKDILSKAEPSYSLDRFHALEDEWSENYGNFELVCEFLRGMQNGFKLKSLNEDSFADAYLMDKPEMEFKGDLLAAVQRWKSEEIKLIPFAKKVLYILFRIGIIGIKKGPTYKVAYYFTPDILISKNDFSTNSIFYVHPSLYSYFKVNVMDQLPEK